MIKKFLFLFICVALVATIVGCSLRSGYGHDPTNADLATTLSGTVRDDGTLEEITFPSGAKVSAPTAGTMQPNVVVTVTESKTSEIGANAIGTPSYIYLYAITAILTSDNNPTKDVRVSSLEQPLSISLPTNHLGTSGVCYVGIRFSPDDPWQYRTVSDTGTIALGLRGSANAIPAECNISLYRPNILIALFAYNEESASSTANISVSGMTATSTPIVGIKDEVYQNDLTVKLSLEGANLNGLNASDLTAAVTYRSSREMPVTVKANGTTVSQTTASDKAVTGANYTHTFKVPNLAFDTPLGTTADLSFVINTKDMNASDFPTEFLIELNGVSENVIGGSFVCSEYFAFETASLNENMFSIAYDLAGGNLEEGVSNPTAYGEASETFTLNNPVKSGNTFAGWTGTGLEEATMEVTIVKGSTGNREYTATWTENPPDTYNITYSGIDGATFEDDKLTSYNVGSLPVTLNNPSKTGYTFIGWTWEGQSEAVLEATIAQNSTGDKEFTANWSINSYRLDLIAGTGIATVTGSGTYEYNSSVTASCTMKAGYEFVNWTGDLATDSFNMPAQNATMTANASLISYSISYDLAGGTVATANPTSYDVTSATITLNNPTREGFDFVGWTGTGIATGTASQNLTIPLGSTGNRSYVASWTENPPDTYNITYNGIDGATFEDDKLTSYNVGSLPVTLNNPSKVGYTFTGWTWEGQTEAVLEATIAEGSTGDKEFTANWRINSYRLDLIAGTGIATVTGSGTYEYNSSVTASCTMKAGYEFANWSGDFTTGTFNMPANNATMTANATPISYSIAYDLAGGTVATANPTSYDVTSATITLNNPTREGFDFVGWTGTGIATGTASQTLTIPLGSTGNRSYVASWTLNIEYYTLNLIKGTGIDSVSGAGSYQAGTSVTASCTMLAGYEFANWTGDLATDSFNMPAQNATMTANASLISYSISYDLASGTVATANPTSYDVTSATITLNNPTRDGYDFVGWTGTGIATGTASQTLTIPLGSTGNRSYVASWTEAASFLTFNLGNGVTMELKRCGDTGMFMGTYEVTQEQYFAIMGTNPSINSGNASCPVEYVSWNDIMAENGFIAKLNASDTIQAYLTAKGLSGYQFALPTQSQWKTACDAGTTTEDSDDNVNDRAWYWDNWGDANRKTHDVGYKSPNAWGLYDMRGNVMEWTSTQSGSNRVLCCGGAWHNVAPNCRSSSFDTFVPDDFNFFIGFRVALVAPESK